MLRLSDTERRAILAVIADVERRGRRRWLPRNSFGRRSYLTRSSRTSMQHGARLKAQSSPAASKRQSDEAGVGIRRAGQHSRRTAFDDWRFRRALSVVFSSVLAATMRPFLGIHDRQSGHANSSYRSPADE